MHGVHRDRLIMTVMDKRKKQSRTRTWFQAAWFAVTNGYLRGYTSGKIFAGGTKRICVPGLNCYSCPGAFGSCPIGSLQAVLDSRNYKISLYVFGFLTVFGVLFGRLVCGWMCPFGLVQDLLYKIKTKFKKKTVYYQPNVGAAIFLLTNLDPEHYQNKQNGEFILKNKDDKKMSIDEINAEIERLKKLENNEE